MKKNLIYLFIFLILILTTIISLSFIIPSAKPLLNQNNPNIENYFGKSFEVIGLGDSLTEGVGDDSGLGGYLPLVEKSLENYYDVSVINTLNYGKNGNRVPQLTKRIVESPEIQENIINADIIILTIGGNDLLKVLKDNIFATPSWDTFEIAKEEYIVNLNTLYQTIRNLNKTSPIYHLGIYNPFYQNFQEVTEIQEMVDNWNLSTETFITEQDNVIFVPINNIIYSESNILSDEDSFHPNLTGYQMIANEFVATIINTQLLWQKEK